MPELWGLCPAWELAGLSQRGGAESGGQKAATITYLGKEQTVWPL